ncbi:MAG: hypothetical protein QXD48_03655 [Candidatus Aenigmatarchaeota archaeon]
MYKESDVCRLRSGILAHRVGAICLYSLKIERSEEKILENIMKNGLYNPVYLNITNFDGINGSVNDSLNGYGKRGFDVKTNKYGRKKLSVIFNYELNRKLRQKDIFSDELLDMILQKTFDKFGNSLHSKNKDDWVNINNFVIEEFNKNRICILNIEYHEDIIPRIFSIYLYDKFKEKNIIDEKCKMFVDYFYSPIYGFSASELEKLNNNNYLITSFDVTKDYFEAFIFCTQMRKPKIKINITPKLIGEIENIPIYLI